MALEGMHDLYYGLEKAAPPEPNTADLGSCHRIGEPYLKIPPEKVIDGGVDRLRETDPAHSRAAG